MKKGLTLPGAALLALLPLALLAGCIRDVEPILEDRYTSFPEVEILGASFYYQANGKDVTGDDAGYISKNKDGTYKVGMRRRAPSNVPTAMFITGSFEFSEFYKIICTFPEDPLILHKPYRVYACASVGMDGNTEADYPTANDLKGQAVFRNGVAIGTFEMTNEGINYLNRHAAGKPYITVFLYLYFQNPSDPNDPQDYYEFTLNYAGGANGITPESVVTKAEIYRAGDTANKFMLDDNDGEAPILARYNIRFDSRKISPAVPVINTGVLHIDLQVPDEDAGKNIEFELRNTGLISGETNNITRAMNSAARVLAGTGGSEQTGVATEVRVPGNPPTYYYRIKAQTVMYPNLFGAAGTGVRLVIPGDETFNAVDRFTCTIYLPDKFAE